MGLFEIIPSASAAKKILFQSLLHTEKGKMGLKIHQGFIAASQLSRTAQWVTLSSTHSANDKLTIFDDMTTMPTMTTITTMTTEIETETEPLRAIK